MLRAQTLASFSGRGEKEQAKKTPSKTLQCAATLLGESPSLLSASSLAQPLFSGHEDEVLCLSAMSSADLASGSKVTFANMHFESR
jgi:hypothetical protein